MMGIIIALLLGYWLRKSEKKEEKQIDKEYTGSVECDVDYGYVLEGESVEYIIDMKLLTNVIMIITWF